MSTILRIAAAAPFLMFALGISGENHMAALILAGIAAAILWPLVRGSK